MTEQALLHSGARTVLRRFRTSDLQPFLAYRGDAEVARFQSWAPMDAEEARRFLTEMERAPLLVPGQWSQIAIALPDDGRLIGDIGLCPDEEGDAVEVGVTLSRAAWGKGLAQDAIASAFDFVFLRTRVKRIIAIADERNEASIRLMHRLGMEEEARYDTEFQGVPCREVRSVLLRPGTGAVG